MAFWGHGYEHFMNGVRFRWAILVAALLATYGLLSINALVRESATFDETAHLVSGYSYLKLGDYRLNSEHPPLLKSWAALPLLTQSVWPFDRQGFDDSASYQGITQSWAAAKTSTDPQWFYSRNLLYGVHDSTLARLGVRHPAEIPSTAALAETDFLNDADRLLLLGRLPMVMLGIGLGLLVFFWARELFGLAGGVFSLALYCFDPNFIAHAGLVTTDVGVSLFMAGTVYFFWRYLQRQKLLDAMLVALFFAMSIGSKFSAVLLMPVLVMLAAFPSPAPMLKKSILLVACAVSAYVMLWAVYGFRFSFVNEPGSVPAPVEQVLRRTAATRLVLRAQLPGGAPEYAIQQVMPKARISVSGQLLLFAHRQHLLPEAYLYGFAFAEMKSLQRDSYLMGRQSASGWWYYFPVAFLLKTPLITLLAIVVSLVWLLWRGMKPRQPMFFLLLPVGVYLGVSMLSNLNIGHRHLLPVYPFLFVACGGLGLWWEKRSAWRVPIAIAAFVAVVASTQFCLRPLSVVGPHYLAYFNELAGGGRSGYRYLVDSNLDWGQDLKKLRAWLTKHQVFEPVNLCYFGTADPLYHRIPHVNLPGGYIFEPTVSFNEARLPGYVIISATSLQGVYMNAETQAAWREFLKPAILVDTVGHSLFIFYRK